MKSLVLSFGLLILIAGYVNAQEENYYVSPDSSVNLLQYDAGTPPFSSGKRLNMGLNMGSSLGSFYGNTLFTNYISPEIRYSFTPKFSLTAGTMFTYSMYGNSVFGDDSGLESEASKQARFYLYARGEYQVSDRLWVRAGGFAEVTPGASQYGYKAGHVGMTFKISEETWFNADFQINSGYPGTDLYYSNGGIFGDPTRFGNYEANPYSGLYW
ncbi:MAG: hypothetical protein KBB11_04260 [Bacteroidales bacterium]|nr:hypothetical protein [Bacteroidales bacterium]HOY38709.1 hypothetical protein [Bacteroidales bacterium]HQP05280.1 hypothetical protein [Bacteroidales bacterium]